MDKEIISNKLKNVNIDTLFENLIAPESQIYKSKKSGTYNCYEIFNKNMNFLKGLTYEELILYIILDKIENKYEIFPRIIFYEYYKTINGEKVVVSDKIEPGYSEADCVIYSKCNYKYEEEPLIVQKKYDLIYNNLSYSNGKFEIKDGTLYFIELKSSFNFSGEEDEKKKLSKYENFFTNLFNKYKEFIHLYESKRWIKKDTNKEILLIYDNDIIEISKEIEDIINNLLKKNLNCTFKIIYTLKTYPFFSHSLAISKYNQVTQKYNELAQNYNELTQKYNQVTQKYNQVTQKYNELTQKYNQVTQKYNELTQKHNQVTQKIEELLKENKEIKEQLDNLSKKNGYQINNKVENNEKKNKVSQNVESQNNEKKNNATNNMTKNSEVTNNDTNNNETKKDEKKINEN